MVYSIRNPIPALSPSLKAIGEVIHLGSEVQNAHGQIRNTSRIFNIALNFPK